MISIFIRTAWRLAMACLWLSLLVSPGCASGFQFPASSFQPPAARAFAAPVGHATAWLTPGPAPELWLAVRDEPPRLVLAGESEHFSTPIWSPDGSQVAVLAVSTGTETAALGRWWVADTAGDGAAHQASIPPEWIGPLPESRSSILAAPGGSGSSQSAICNPQSAIVPPPSIRVAHHPANSCRNLPDWAVTVIPFEEYVARVLPAEVYTSWPAATLQAQAIAVRTFAWRKVLLAPPDATYDISDWAVDQVMCDARYPATDAATAATAGRYLAYGGEIILAQYSAENGHPTLDGGLPYLKPVLDPVSLGRTRYGHGHGLSQWGAQRWASQRGWNATQILTHYYTGVQVVDPLGGNPSLSLLTAPRGPSSWLTGSTAYLTAHASFAPTATVTMTFAAPGFQSLGDFGSLSGLWSAEWPLPATLTRPVTITASAAILSPTGAPTQTITFTHALTLAGEDRSPPAIHRLTLPTSAPSLTITLHISATDAGASGLAGVAAGGDWQAVAADFIFLSGAGTLVADPDALGGHALALPADVASRWEATLPQSLATNQIYQAYVRVRTASNVPGTSEVPGTWGRVELYDPTSNELLGFADLRPGDFRQAGVYQEFPIDFWLSPQANGGVGIRLITADSLAQRIQSPISNLQSAIFFDRVQILHGPTSFGTDAPHRLEHRAGPQPVVVKVLDAAGNPSAEVSGTTQLVDTAPPGAWQLLAPTGWVTTTLRPTIRAFIADDLTGIAPSSAVARFTTDAGVSWSAWLPVSATTKLDGSAELVWDWPGGEGSGANRVQFQASDNVGLIATGPAWPVRVDVTPPAVTLAAPRWATAGRSFTVQWFGWDGVAGLATFDVQVSSSNVPGTFEVPGTSSEVWQDWLRETTATYGSYPAPASGVVRFRVRAHDLAGNTGAWSAPQAVMVTTALQFLPFALASP
ncbi:MAG: hypothetical protein NT169_12040 [Chloroflexi bacterium]|nr:hypothetical protein [Chloroflexota bacterium]